MVHLDQRVHTWERWAMKRRCQVRVRQELGHEQVAGSYRLLLGQLLHVLLLETEIPPQTCVPHFPATCHEAEPSPSPGQWATGPSATSR